MTIETGDYVRAVIEMSLPGTVTALNVWDWACEAAPGGGVADGDVCDAVETKLEAMYDDIKGYLTSDVSTGIATIYEMEWSVDKWQVKKIMGTRSCVVTGTDAGDSLPNQMAAVLVFPSTLSKSRGRRYIGGLAEAAVTENSCVSGAATAFAAFLTEYLTDITSIADTVLAPAYLRKGGTHFAISTGILSEFLGVQRRRRPGVGV